MKIEENWVPGSSFLRIFGQWGCLWEPEAFRPGPDPKTSKSGHRFWGHFGGRAAPKMMSFFCVFFGVPFFGPWAPFGRPKARKGYQKEPQSEPKGSPEAPCGTCENPWYLLYGRHIGRSRGGPGNHFFHDGAAKGPPEASGGGFGPIL